jgi:hypothetical protein
LEALRSLASVTQCGFFAIILALSVIAVCDLNPVLAPSPSASAIIASSAIPFGIPVLHGEESDFECVVEQIAAGNAG